MTESNTTSVEVSGTQAAEEQNAHVANPAQEQPQEAPKAALPIAEVSYAPTGDTGLDVALRMVGKLGIQSDSPEMEAARTGDFLPLTAVLRRFGTNDEADIILSLLQDAHSRYQASAETSEAPQRDSSAFVALAGSPEAWDTVLGWAQQNASEEEAEVILAAFEKGGDDAAEAAQFLIDLYQTNVGNPMSLQSLRQSTDGSPAPARQEGFKDSVDYVAQLNQLMADNPGIGPDHPKYVAMQKARLKQLRSQNV